MFEIISANGEVKERGWFLYLDPSQQIYEIHNNLQEIARQQKNSIESKSSNVAVFAIQINEDRILNSDAEDIIFCSSDGDSGRNLEGKRLYKMLTPDGNFEIDSFLNHQKQLLTKTEFGDIRLEKERKEYGKIIKRKLEHDFPKPLKVIQQKFPRGDPNLACIVSWLKEVVIDPNPSYDLKKTIEEYGTWCVGMHAHLLDSEQRILYYLLRDESSKFIEIVKSKSSNIRKITLHLHTYYDPCEVCGPVLAFAKRFLQDLIYQQFGEKVDFDLFVSCSEMRDETLVEEGVIPKDLKQLFDRLKGIHVPSEAQDSPFQELYAQKDRFVSDYANKLFTLKQRWLYEKLRYDDEQARQDENYCKVRYPLLILNDDLLKDKIEAQAMEVKTK